MTKFIGVFPKLPKFFVPEFSEFRDKKFVITVKGFGPQSPLVLETSMLSQRQQDTCERWDISIEPNSCFSDYQFS